MYPLYANRHKSQVPWNGDPHILTKRICVLSWSQVLLYLSSIKWQLCTELIWPLYFQKIKSQWLFFFKLKQLGYNTHGRGSEEPEKPDLLKMLGDITANVDDNCKVLQVNSLTGK